MSGEPIIVLPGAAMAPLVQAAAKVAQAGLGRYAVIGGVAVSARLGQAHSSDRRLHAIEDRRPSGGMDKRAGDAWDIYRILLDLDRDGRVRRELATLEQPLRQAVAAAGARILMDRAARTVSWLKAGDERMARVTIEDLRSLAEPALEALDEWRGDLRGP